MIGIIGAGPAGLAAAIRLTKAGFGPRITLIDGGSLPDRRICPKEAADQPCIGCSVCALTHGFGGAGLFSDGKITLDSNTGGSFVEHGFVDSADELEEELYEKVYKLIVEFGGPNEIIDPDTYGLQKEALVNNLLFLPQKIQHIGSDGCGDLIAKIYEYLVMHGVSIHPNYQLYSIRHSKDGWIVNRGGYKFRYLIIGIGRSGASILRDTLPKLGIGLAENGLDIGVRVEVPSEITEHITDRCYSFKYVYRTKLYDDEVRTFCVNPHGYVTTEGYDGLVMVNGFSRKDVQSPNTNFALLVNIRFTSPFNNPLAYMQNIARLSNYLGDPIIIQRLGDLRSGRRSTPERIRRSFVKPTLPSASPGDLSFVMPGRIMTNILEMLQVLDNVMPGVNSDNTLLYGVEAKFYSVRVKDLDRTFRVRPGLYVVGDCSGVCRGISHSMLSGIRAAEGILDNHETE